MCKYTQLLGYLDERNWMMEISIRKNDAPVDQGKVMDMGTCRKTYGNIVGKNMGIRRKLMRCINNNWNPTGKKPCKNRMVFRVVPPCDLLRYFSLVEKSPVGYHEAVMIREPPIHGRCISPKGTHTARTAPD